MNSTNIGPLLGLLGVLVAAISTDLNESVSEVALIDVRDALGISADPGRWIDSLFITGSALGTQFAPWIAVTFTLRRFTSSLLAWHARRPLFLRLRLIFLRSSSFG